MKEELNSGVRCNVTTCVYNENGCNCNKNIIDVSQGDKPMPNGGQPHFCKSYINKKQEPTGSCFYLNILVLLVSIVQESSVRISCTQ